MTSIRPLELVEVAWESFAAADYLTRRSLPTLDRELVRARRIAAGDPDRAGLEPSRSHAMIFFRESRPRRGARKHC
jgi:hypothetical protein